MSSARRKSRHGIVKGVFSGDFGGVTTGSVCATPSGVVNITINGIKLRAWPSKRAGETVEAAVEREIGEYSELKFEEVVMESESDESESEDEDAPLPAAQGISQTPRSRPKVDKYSPTKHMTPSELKHVQERATGRRITGSPTMKHAATCAGKRRSSRRGVGELMSDLGVEQDADLERERRELAHVEVALPVATSGLLFTENVVSEVSGAAAASLKVDGGDGGDDYSKYKVGELREFLVRRGLDSDGLKQVLIDRLREHDGTA